MALVRYARNVRNHTKDALHKAHATETAFAKERKQRRQVQAEALNLQSRLERFEKIESKLNMWESRKPKIFHYLGIFGEMMRQAGSFTDLAYRAYSLQ